MREAFMEEVAFEMDVPWIPRRYLLPGGKELYRGKQRRGEVCRSRESKSVAGHVLGRWLEVWIGPSYRGA